MTESWLERQIVVMHAMGLHARPAVFFVRTAQRFETNIELECRGQAARAKSVLSVLSLMVNQGMSFTIRADGPAATTATDAICALVACSFERGKEPNHDHNL